MLFFFILVLWFCAVGSVLGGQNSGIGQVDVVMELPEPDNHSQSLPFHVTGSCRDGRHLQLYLKSVNGADTTPIPRKLTVLITGELDLFYHHEMFMSDLKTGALLEVDVPQWATGLNGYVSIHVASEGVLLATWEFIKLAELCGLTAEGSAAETSFNGDLPSHHPKH